MSSSITCGNCGEPITGELPGLDPAQRMPCAKCGSLARAFNVHMRDTASYSDSFQAAVITYPQSLLSVSRNLIDQGQFSISVVVAHMACEIATERSLSESFAARGVQYLEDATTDLLNGYNLANRQIRKLYTALTGDDVQNEAFWQKFKDSATRRNKIMHAGLLVGKAEAEESFKAASDLVAHLKK